MTVGFFFGGGGGGVFTSGDFLSELKAFLESIFTLLPGVLILVFLYCR